MTFLQTLKARFSKPNRAPNISQQPILSAQQIADWGQELEAYWASLPSSQRLSELALFGDQSSRFRGQGMEYEESRLYQPGDELRHLNWRLMARTGKAFTKLFQEERQAQWVILLDQRQSMRFATQGQLKVTQGARIAGWLAWMAQQQRVQIQAIGLSETVSMTPVIQGMNLYQQVMQALAIPCPPKADQVEPKLADVLNQLKAHWPNGTRVWIISDFADLTESDQAWLTAMNESWHLSAFWIEDPAEVQLPAKQPLKLQTHHQAWLLDNQQQSQYQTWAKPQRDKHQAWLKQAGVDVHSVQTTDNLQRILATEL